MHEPGGPPLPAGLAPQVAAVGDSNPNLADSSGPARGGAGVQGGEEPFVHLKSSQSSRDPRMADNRTEQMKQCGWTNKTTLTIRHKTPYIHSPAGS